MPVNIIPTRTKVGSVEVANIADLLAYDAERIEVFIFNESTQTLKVIAGAGGGADDYTYTIPASGTWSVSGHAATSAWRGFWAAVNGQARVTAWK